MGKKVVQRFVVNKWEDVSLYNNNHWGNVQAKLDLHCLNKSEPTYMHRVIARNA